MLSHRGGQTTSKKLLHQFMIISNYTSHFSVLFSCSCSPLILLLEYEKNVYTLDSPLILLLEYEKIVYALDYSTS